MTIARSDSQSVTTIKVTTDTRNHLKALAKMQACTIDEYLNKLIAMAYREQRWDELRASIAKMTPDEREAYNRDVDDYRGDSEWDGVTVDSEWQSVWDATRSS